MTNKELMKEISKMEEVIDDLLEFVIDANYYTALRYYFSQSDYSSMKKILENMYDKGDN